MTLDQLKRRGRALPNICFLCCEEEESIEHVLMHSSFARDLWFQLLALAGVDWVLPYLVRELLFG